MRGTLDISEESRSNLFTLQPTFFFAVPIHRCILFTRCRFIAYWSLEGSFLVVGAQIMNSLSTWNKNHLLPSYKFIAQYPNAKEKREDIFCSPELTLCELGAVFAPLGIIIRKTCSGPSISNKQSARKAMCENCAATLTPRKILFIRLILRSIREMRINFLGTRNKSKTNSKQLLRLNSMHRLPPSNSSLWNLFRSA